MCNMLVNNVDTFYMLHVKIPLHREAVAGEGKAVAEPAESVS